ncbi:zinc finger, CCHC-type containing protein [Tanacetum coccineum]
MLILLTKKVAVHLFEEYTISAEDEIKLLHQKIKIKWLKEGDRNIAYFQRVLKARKHKSRVESICREDGKRYVGNEVSHQFVHHFNKHLGTSMPVMPLNSLGDIVKLKLTNEIPLTLMVLQEIPLVWVYSALLFNWLDHPPTGSILTWDDLTTRFLAQFFPPESTAKLRNDILMFQQHQGESLYDAWNYFKDLLRKVPHNGLDLWLQVQIFYDYVNHTTQMAIDDAAGGRLRKLRPKESWKTIKDLA